MKPRVAIFDMTSCDGCQTTILNLEEYLVDIANAVDIVNFRLGTEKVSPGPYDISIVEGSISRQEEVKKIKWIRENSKTVIALGACATHGGPQALSNRLNKKDIHKEIYGNIVPKLNSLDAKGIDQYIKVDHYIRGCPIDKFDFLNILKQFLIGKIPKENTNPVCVECRFNENVCQFMELGACLGPFTYGGCGAICPTNNLPCDGCRGALDDLNLEAGIRIMKKKNIGDDKIKALFRKYVPSDKRYEKFEEMLKNVNNKT
ncbi:hypothetical protein JW930_04800 [Candidatus Woesearchaeota archaeon]|nr:hypothetical protein [Candidatus Woesearchaeota archaeon]